MLYMFKPSCWPMFKPPSLGPPWVLLDMETEWVSNQPFEPTFSNCVQRQMDNGSQNRAFRLMLLATENSRCDIETVTAWHYWRICCIIGIYVQLFVIGACRTEAINSVNPGPMTIDTLFWVALLGHDNWTSSQNWVDTSQSWAFLMRCLWLFSVIEPLLSSV